MNAGRIRHLGRCLATVSLVGMLLGTVAPARAAEYADEDSNPFRIIYYFVYPVGKVLEYTVTRPLHAASRYVAPYQHIDEKRSNECSRERPSRNCTRTIH